MIELLKSTRSYERDPIPKRITAASVSLNPPALTSGIVWVHTRTVSVCKLKSTRSYERDRVSLCFFCPIDVLKSTRSYERDR